MFRAIIFLALVAACATAPVLRALRATMRLLDHLAAKPAAAIATVFIVAMLSMAAPALIGRLPVPAVHDEFAYLLSADTFARGRIANPTHALWEYLETFHVIHQPTYASKFPPAQGMALAMGQVLWHPILGAWLSTAAACAAAAWMLRCWAPPGWALLGGFAAAIHPAVHWWSQSYWGGAVTMLGAALLGGGAARAMRQARASHAAILAVGAAILANSRPFEGLIVSAIVGSVLLATVARRHGWRSLFGRVLVPAALVLLPVFGAMMYYNWRITGSAFTMPYTVHRDQYMMAPLFHWGETHPQRNYRHEVLRRFHLEHELAVYLKQQTLRGFLDEAREKLRMLGRAFIQPVVLALPLLASLLALRRVVNRMAVAVCVLLPLLHILLSPWMRIQYMAAAAPFLLALIVVGLRRLTGMTFRGRPLGAAVAGAVVIAHVVAGIAWAVRFNRTEPPPPGRERAQLVAQLEQLPGKHLVIMRYGPSHPPTSEWVFNEADIDAARIVFARELNPAGDEPLMSYFDDRSVWVVSVDGDFEVVRVR